MLYHYYFGFYTIIPVLILSLIVQASLRATYARYSRVANRSGITGAQMAHAILQGAGIYDVQVQCVGGQLTDHYNPAQKTVNLSEAVYNGTSVAAIGIAAHECGHVLQYRENYAPIRLRSSVIGITSFSSRLLYVLMIASFFFNSYSASALIFNTAIICYVILFFFQLITLPVEFNASARAVACVRAMGFSESDIAGAKKVLSAAAMTYVASAITVLWHLLLLMSRARNRR